MQLTAEQIRSGILHPDWQVRDMALDYFENAFSSDLSVMPQLIRAVEKYGWTEACLPFWIARPLEQTEETVRWLIEQLDQPNPAPGRERLWKCWMRFLSWQLHNAPAELLLPHEATLRDLAELDPACRESIQERLPMTFRDPDSGWEELQEYCDESTAAFEPIDYADEDFFRYCEVIARGGAELAGGRVLELLADPLAEDWDDPQFWMQSAAARLAGLLRLERAISLLLDRMREDIVVDGQWYCYLCSDALIRIGSDAVIRAVAEPFSREGWDYRSLGAQILGAIRTPLAVHTGLELLSRESEASLRGILADSLLFQFDTQVIDPVRNCILRGHGGDEEEKLIRRLMAAATLLNVTIPESEPWSARAQESAAEYRHELEDRLTEDGRLPDAWDAELDEMERMADSLEDDEDEEHDENDTDFAADE